MNTCNPIPNVIPQGYLVKYTNQQHAEYRHVRYGDPGRLGAWCPQCNEPLLRIMDVDTRDPRLGLSHLPYASLPLLYCLYCTLCLDTLYYQVDTRGEITLINAGQSDAFGDPFERLPHNLPATPVRLQPLTDDEQQFLVEGYKTYHTSWPANDPPSPFAYLHGHNDQIGGEPFLDCRWVDYEFSCPCCGEVMPFLATFSDEIPSGEQLCGKENFIQLVYAFCGTCSVVGVVHTNFM